MLNSVDILLEHADRVLAGECKMAGIIKQINKVGVGYFHELVDLCLGLNTRAHMMMHGEVHSFLFGKSAHLIEALCYESPLLVGVNGLLAEDADALALDGVALLGGADDLCAESVQEISVLDKGFDSCVIALGE